MNKTTYGKIEKILKDQPKEEWLDCKDAIKGLVNDIDNEHTSNYWKSFNMKVADLFDSKKKRRFFSGFWHIEVSREKLDEWINSDDRYSMDINLGADDINSQYDIFLKYYKDICSLNCLYDGTITISRKEDRFGLGFIIHNHVDTDLSSVESRLCATTLLYEGWSVEI